MSAALVLPITANIPVSTLLDPTDVSVELDIGYLIMLGVAQVRPPRVCSFITQIFCQISMSAALVLPITANIPVSTLLDPTDVSVELDIGYLIMLGVAQVRPPRVCSFITQIFCQISMSAALVLPITANIPVSTLLDPTDVSVELDIGYLIMLGVAQVRPPRVCSFITHILPDINECSSSSTNNCQHTCVNTLGSYTCRCRAGYTLNSNGRTCTG